MFTVLAAAALSETGVRDWSSFALANMAIAFAKVGHKNESLFMAYYESVTVNIKNFFDVNQI